MSGTPAVWGGVLGGLAAVGLLLVAARVAALRRPSLALRVLPYVRDLTPDARPTTTPGSRSAWAAVFGPPLRAAADLVERVLGGAASVRRRLARAGLDRTVHEFRVEQVVWGLAGFAAVATYAVLASWSRPGNPVPLLLMCAVGFAVGVLLRDQHLSAQVRRRERAISAEFPTVAELLALAVAAGEGPVSALDRVVSRSGGELSRDLAQVLARIRTGEPVADAFDALAASSGVPVVARFAHGVAVAVESIP